MHFFHNDAPFPQLLTGSIKTKLSVQLSLQDGWTALMHASRNGHTETVKCLIEANVALDIQDKVIHYCFHRLS